MTKTLQLNGPVKRLKGGSVYEPKYEFDFKHFAQAQGDIFVFDRATFAGPQVAHSASGSCSPPRPVVSQCRVLDPAFTGVLGA